MFQQFNINSVIIHPKFDATNLHNDIAILKLATKAKITDYVQIISLWEGDNDISKIENRLGRLAGWGKDEYGSFPQHLQHATMPVVSQIACLRSYPEFFSKFSTDNDFCAGYRNGWCSTMYRQVYSAA